MRRLFTSFCTVGLIVILSMTLRADDEAKRADDQFAGFPEIGKYRPGRRTSKIIPTDRIKGVVRPKWTRAMGDLGGWPSMFRFKKSILLSFPDVDGHRGKVLEGTGLIINYRSTDEGKTWEKLPTRPNTRHGECVVVGDTMYSYGFQDLTQTVVTTSTDGVNWSKPKKVYKAPFWLWGVMYDEESKTFWAPAHCIPKKVPGTRQIHLIKSKDGFQWEHVSTVHYNQRESESTLYFEQDRTMVIMIRKKQVGRLCWIATAKPPYKQWDISERPFIAEGQHFHKIDGKVFLAGRRIYVPQTRADKNMFTGTECYSTIDLFTKDRQIQPWAVMDSTGDCSYPQVVETPTEILCAYYSQHEDGVCKVFLCAYDKAEFLRGP